MKKILLFILLFMSWGMAINAQFTNDHTYTDFNGNFNSAYGTGDLHAPYANNLYNRYVIAPVGAARIKLNLYNYDFGNNSSVDTIYVYDGADFESPLLATFSADNPPSTDTIYSTGNVISIFFETDDVSYGEYGWMAEYFGVKPVPTLYTDAAGTFTGGILASPYDCGANFKLLEYLIKPVGATMVELSLFDFWPAVPTGLCIYDGENETAPLIGTYDDSNWPPIVRSSGNSIFIRVPVYYDCNFFTAQYTSISQTSSISYQYDATGNREHRNIIILKSAKAPGGKNDGQQNNASFDDKKPHQEKSGNQNITIYPNPTAGQLKVDIAGFDATKKSTIYVYDPMGKLIIQKSPLTGSDIIDLSVYNNGLFLMQIVLGDKVSEWKIIKE